MEWLNSLGNFAGSLFGGGSATGAATDAGGSWLSRFGSSVVDGLSQPETILGTVGLFAGNSANKQKQEDALNATTQATQQKFENDIAILNLKHQQDIELMQMKGAGGGGGSGAAMAIANAELALKRKQMAQERAIAKLSAVQNAKKMQLDATMGGADLTQRALQNLMQGATAPLGR